VISSSRKGHAERLVLLREQRARVGVLLGGELLAHLADRRLELRHLGEMRLPQRAPLARLLAPERLHAPHHRRPLHRALLLDPLPLARRRALRLVGALPLALLVARARLLDRLAPLPLFLEPRLPGTCRGRVPDMSRA